MASEPRDTLLLLLLAADAGLLLLLPLNTADADHAVTAFRGGCMECNKTGLERQPVQASSYSVFPGTINQMNDGDGDDDDV